MTTRIISRLGAARERQFVGRTAEVELFRSALTAAELPFNVLYLYGPGGVGKTALLNAFARAAGQLGSGLYSIDARSFEPSPEALLASLRQALGLTGAESPAHVLAARAGTQVIQVDTCELLAPLEHWIQDRFLPSLPENTLLVMAGRNPPPAAWRADAAWQSLIRVLSLRNLSPQESRDFLARRTVPPVEHAAVLNFTHGHPLALSLVADVFDQRPQVHFEPAAEPDIIRILLDQFVQKVPGPAHRAALEVCALVRTTTEGLLAEMLHMSDVHELFGWLRGLSFVDASREGLFPHDLARDALAADLRWRNPDWYGELHHRARTYYMERIGQGSALTQQRLLFDYIFLHRDNPAVAPFFAWQASGGLLADAMHADDAPALLAMVEKHEGPESARLAARWLETQSRGVVVIRDSDGQVAGFVAMTTHSDPGLPPRADNDPDGRTSPDLGLAVSREPAVHAAWNYLHSHAPLRPGESATLFRYWMARDTYQAVAPVQSLIFVIAVRHYLTTPGLAFTFFPCADPDFWAAVFAYADLARLPEADFQAGGRTYGMYGHDWRQVPPLAWLELLGKRELADETQAAQAAAEPLIVLSEAAFAEAVQEALRDYVRPEALRSNPLSRSRLVVEEAGAGASPAKRAEALRKMLRGASEALQRSPRETKLVRAIEQTYFEPAQTQEIAAERLDLPFSTYRRHLKSGVARITEILWLQEIGSA